MVPDAEAQSPEEDDSRRWERTYRDVLAEVWNTGEQIDPTKGAARELRGFRFSLANPRDRCIQNPAREFDVFQALGQWLWIMAGRMDLQSIRYYNNRATKFSADLVRLHGAYGPRLFGIGVFDQIDRVIQLIKNRPTTRRAVANILLPEFDTHRDEVEGREDEVPCTIALQFLPRDGSLHAITYMRSQDATLVLPVDIFIFTLLQEYVAASTNLELGTYTHLSGSFHAYEDQDALIEGVLEADVRPTPPMPPMPQVDISTQQEHLKEVLKLESQIRNEAIWLSNGKGKLRVSKYRRKGKKLPTFWELVVDGLLIFAAHRTNNPKGLQKIASNIHRCWSPFAARALDAYSSQKTLDYGEYISSDSK